MRRSFKRTISMIMALLTLMSLMPSFAFAGEEAAVEKQAAEEEYIAFPEENAECNVHSHEYVPVDEIPATEESTGLTAHYVCTGCEKLFILENEEYLEIDPSVLIIPVLKISEDNSDSEEPTYSVATIEQPLENGLFENALNASKPVIVASGACGEKVNWSLSSSGKLTISGSGDMDDYDFHYDSPELDWNANPPIRQPWYDYRDMIVEVNVVQGVTSIGDYAFTGAYCLKKATIGDGLLVIGKYSFYCAWELSDLTLPDSVTHIGDSAFRSSRVTKDFKLPPNLVSIGHEAFMECNNITSLSFPTSLISVETDSFRDCSGILSLSVEYGNPVFYSKNDCILYKETNVLFKGCVASVVPEGTTRIGDYAFNGVLFAEFDIPEGITEIGEYAFNDCQWLKYIGIPQSVTSIGKGAFSSCYELNQIRLPGEIKIISERTFDNCQNLKYIWIPEKVEKIEKEAFGYCMSLSSICIPASVDYIDETAFTYCAGLQTIEVDENNSAYTACNNCLIKLETKELIRGGTVSEIPQGVVRICAYAFNGAKNLDDLLIPDSVTQICKNAFASCESLVSIYIPASIVEIGTGAFEYCRNIKYVSYGGTANEWQRVQIGVNNSYLLNAAIAYEGATVPKTCGANMTWELSEEGVLTISGTGMMDSYGYYYQSAPWAGYANRIKTVVVNSGVNSIGRYAFDDCSNLKTVSLPDGINSIEAYAFMGCVNLTSVMLPETLSNIGDSAFSGCTGLTEILIPKNVSYIGDCPFRGCTGLTSITVAEENQYYYSSQNCLINRTEKILIQGCSTSVIPNGVEIIGESAFRGCNSLTEINIPDGVKLVCDGAYYACQNATSLRFPESLESIGEVAFACCEGIKEVALPHNIKSIGSRAFKGWMGFDYLYVPGSLEYINDGAFEECLSLTNVEIEKGVETLGNFSFGYCINLKEIDIPASVSEIGTGAFIECEELSDIYYSGTKTQWNSIVINEWNDELSKATIHFGAKKYEVKYDPNGGSGYMDSQRFHYGTAQKLNANSFYKEGYVFAGWKLGSKTYSDGQSVKNLSSVDGGRVTLVAQWKPDKNYYGYSYNVCFNGNTANKGKMSNQKLNVGTAKALSSNAFIKTGYHFIGWALEPDGEVLFADRGKVRDLSIEYGCTAITLYAIWEKNIYNINFSGNGGKCYPAGLAKAITVYSQTLTYDVVTALTENGFERKGYVFVGWAKSASAKAALYSDCQSGVFNLSSTNKGYVTLYAVWSPIEYSIVYRLDGGVNGTANPESYNTTKAVTLKAPTRPGYSFAGWYDDGTGKKVSGIAKGSFGDKSFTAHWTVNTYNVKYNGNGGKGTALMVKGLQYGINPIIISQNAFNNNGYSFAGWNTKADCSGSAYMPEDVTDFDAKNKATVNLYAMWQYSVTLNPNGGLGEEKKINLLYNNPKVIDEASFQKEGYYLAGWNTNQAKASAGIKQYGLTAKLKNIGPGKVLYAVWKRTA